MAITIEQQPASYMPGHNELMFSASSDESAQSDFQYLVRIDNDTTPIALQAIKPRPTAEGNCFFDAGPIIRGRLSFDPSHVADEIITDNLFFPAAGSFANYTVHFIEQYGSPQQQYASGQVSGMIAINASLQYQQWANITISDYLINITSPNTTKFLTNSPRRLKIGMNERAVLGGISNDTAIDYGNFWGAQNLIVTAYNSAGTQIAQTTIGNLILDPAATQASRFFDVFIGPADINLASQAQTATTAIPANTAYYTVGLQSSDTPDYHSELFTFDIDGLCGKFDPYRLHWLNPLGRIDSYTFKGENITIVEPTEGSEASRSIGFSDGELWEHVATRHSNYQAFSPYKNKWRITATFISEAEKLWLAELANSPAVWYQAGDNGDATTFWAVKLTPITVEAKKIGIRTIGFEMELSATSHSQYR